MARIHIVVATSEDKPKVLYIGTEGAKADAAYESAKGTDSVEHYRYPQPSRRRDGDSASRPTVIREHEDKPESKAESAKA